MSTPYIQNFFTSRDNNANASTYVGQEGRLWWDPLSNKIYYSDGSTPGGIPITGGTGGGGNITIQNQGNTLTTTANLINFTGSGVTTTNVGSDVTVNISAGNVLPPQTGNAQKFLQTDGLATSWQYVAGVFGLWINGGTAFNGGNCLVVDGGGA